MLEKLYLCGINNNNDTFIAAFEGVVICLKNCTFVVSTTTNWVNRLNRIRLWFAWKIVPLWYQQQHRRKLIQPKHVVICLKNCTFVVSTTTSLHLIVHTFVLWFAWKIVPLWYQQQQLYDEALQRVGCDLLEKLYLCGINNNHTEMRSCWRVVVICLKNCTFVVSTTTFLSYLSVYILLWFAWKIVPLWYQQQPMLYNYLVINKIWSCCLLKNWYYREKSHS